MVECLVCDILCVCWVDCPVDSGRISCIWVRFHVVKSQVVLHQERPIAVWTNAEVTCDEVVDSS